MSWDGFIPDHIKIACESCGKNLALKDSGRPAERYMGTFTGLCSSCVNSKPFMEKKWADGSELWNFPPHCPAWRRDRETFFYYPSCTNEKCDHGRVYVSRPLSTGGSYYESCNYCFAKYFNNKYRKMIDTTFQNIYKIGNKVFNARIKQIQKDKQLTDIGKEHMIKGLQIIMKQRADKLIFWAEQQALNIAPREVKCSQS